MKKIEMRALERAHHLAWVGTLKRACGAFTLVLLLSGAGYAAYRFVTGSVIASRFTVNNMNCPACVITVKEVTGKLSGVVETEVSLAGQDVTVKFRDKQTNPETIQEAIAKAGYPVTLDGVFIPSGLGIGEPVAVEVNGKSLFEKDLTAPFEVIRQDGGSHDLSSAVFSVVGNRILLQAADAETIAVQPYEVEAEVQRIMANQGMSGDDFGAWIVLTYGSKEKYYQLVAQRLGIRKLIDEHVLQGVQDPGEKQRKTLEWAGRLLKEANVTILDPGLREKIHALSGQEDWKNFWPRMIAAESDLKNLLLRQ